MQAKQPDFNTTLAVSEPLYRALLNVAQQPLETAGVLLAHLAKDSVGSYRLTAVEYHPVSDSAYLRREIDSLGISSDGYVPALARAESIGALAIWVHCHPGLNSIPRPSTHDEEVDQKISELFKLRTNSGYYSTLIVSPVENGISFTGFLEDEIGHRFAIEHFQVVGDRLHSFFHYDSEFALDMSTFDRNVRALGGQVQRALSHIRVGVVGCGGTGSAVIEQLARLGVRSFVLADPDTLTESNVTRVYGSSPADVGEFKTSIADKNIRRIANQASCRAITEPITHQSAAREFATCDVIFGCTDDNAGRLVLSRLSTYLLIPVIDVGVLISTDKNGTLLGIDGRITTLVPGAACLLCRGRIDINRARSELLSDQERAVRIHEGYAPALPGNEPAVVAFTTMVASVAVSELLERLIGYGPIPRPSEVLVRFHEREISTNVVSPREGHYCDPNASKLGRGVSDPFLDQTWVN